MFDFWMVYMYFLIFGLLEIITNIMWVVERYLEFRNLRSHTV